jgi:hypothetical protein
MAESGSEGFETLDGIGGDIDVVSISKYILIARV